MRRAARFEVVEERPLPVPFATELVVRPIAADPMLPPVTYFRERGEALANGERLPFDDWYSVLRARRDPVNADQPAIGS